MRFATVLPFSAVKPTGAAVALASLASRKQDEHDVQDEHDEQDRQDGSLRHTAEGAQWSQHSEARRSGSGVRIGEMRQRREGIRWRNPRKSCLGAVFRGCLYRMLMLDEKKLAPELLAERTGREGEWERNEARLFPASLQENNGCGSVGFW